MISQLRVQNFRKHTDMCVDFVPGSTIITGTNGSGKTTLIEAIYIALQGRSWRSTFEDIIQNTAQTTADWWRIDVVFSDGTKRTIKYTANERVFEVEGLNYKRLPRKYKKPVVLFEPSDLQLISGSPARRREFFDRFIAQVQPDYTATLRKFERVLQQRNSLLKQGAGQDELFVWDVQFTELAEKIITARLVWVEKLNKQLTDRYTAISNTNNDVTVLSYTAPQKTSQQILNQLHSDATHGLMFTKTGPQAHDFTFKLNGRNMKHTASRGENRTMIFATLGAMTEVMNEVFGKKVYLLFDDIDSELDDKRKNNLYKTKVFTDNYLFATTIKSSGKQTKNHLSLRS